MPDTDALDVAARHAADLLREREETVAIAVREAAEADEQNVSAWLADAARRQLANRGLRDVVAAWEREHGAFSDEELAAARALVDG